MSQTLSHDILVAALAGFKVEQQKLEVKIAHVEAMLKGNAVTSPALTAEAPAGKRRKRSAAARRNMAEAQKARWAKVKGNSEPAASAPEATTQPAKAKRKMSAAGRKAIADAVRKRWADKKAATTATAGKTAPKKAAVKASPKKAAKATRKAAARKTVAPPVAAPTA